MSRSVEVSLETHWYANVALVNPSWSTMAVVVAVSVCFTCAVPLMVGCPVARLLLSSAFGRVRGSPRLTAMPLVYMASNAAATTLTVVALCPSG